MNLEAKYHHWKLEAFEREAYEIRSRLVVEMENDDWCLFDGLVAEAVETSVREKKDRRKRKFEKLLKKHAVPSRVGCSPELIDDFVVNLSNEVFSTDDLAILNKGLGFAMVPSALPVDETIVDLQQIAKSIARTEDFEEGPLLMAQFEKEATEALLPVCKKRLMSSGADVVALMNQKNVQIVKADKGNRVVVLGKTDYDEKMMDHINTGPYRLINNPLNATIRDFPETVKSLRTIDERISMKWSNSNPTVPRLYGLPKIYKSGPLKMRPIASNVSATTELLAKWLVDTFREIGPVDGFAVKNGLDFVDSLKSTRLKRTESLVSFDIVSMFPNVPVPVAIDFLEERGVNVELEQKKRLI